MFSVIMLLLLVQSLRVYPRFVARSQVAVLNQDSWWAFKSSITRVSALEWSKNDEITDSDKALSGPQLLAGGR